MCGVVLGGTVMPERFVEANRVARCQMKKNLLRDSWMSYKRRRTVWAAAEP